MAYEDLVRSHVERCLQDIWEVRRLEQDDDGDYPFRTKSCLGWVRVEPQPSDASSGCSPTPRMR